MISDAQYSKTLAEAPTVLKPNFDKIPELLRNQPRWIVWKVGKIKSDGKYAKIPCDCHTAKAANAHDLRIWLTFDEVTQAYMSGGFDGIGLVLDGEPVAQTDDGADLYLAGIDIDHCLKKDDDGKLSVDDDVKSDWVKLGKPYAERSPSNTGLRMFALTRDSLKSRNANGREIYTDKRFLTITGKTGAGDIKDITTELNIVYKRWFGVLVNNINAASNTDLISHTSPTENAEEIARVKDMLSYVSADCDYEVYRSVIWAIEGTDWGCREELGRAWSQSAEHRFDESTFQQLRKSYSNSGGIHFGTLVHLAKQAGWQPEKNPVNALAAVQGKFALISLGGKIGIIDKRELENTSADGTASRLVIMNRIDGGLLVQRFLANEYPQVDTVKMLAEFTRCKNTTLYNGIEFNPRNTTHNVLNLWVGATITPKFGQWPLIHTLLLEVLCGGRQSEYQYLIKYIAHALQRPWEKPGVMIILLGGQGIGKGTLAKLLKKIWGATFLQVNRIKQVVGDFNGSMERAYIVFLDEALFAGDRASSDALKSLVTESTISVNEKHQPARQITSYHRFFSATNADHFKATDRDDRRDFVLRVSEHRKGDHTFWGALNAEIEQGGVEAFTHDLLAMDLTGFNVRVKPNTRELTEQKLQSLDNFPRWWFDCLYKGMVVPHQSDWPEFISSASLLKLFVEYEKSVRTYKHIIDRDVVAYIAKICPAAKREQGMEDLQRRRGFILPTLAIARKDFENYIGDQIEWDVL
jgi:hypothetical protein